MGTTMAAIPPPFIWAPGSDLQPPRRPSAKMDVPMIRVFVRRGYTDTFTARLRLTEPLRSLAKMFRRAGLSATPFQGSPSPTRNSGEAAVHDDRRQALYNAQRQLLSRCCGRSGRQ